MTTQLPARSIFIVIVLLFLLSLPGIADARGGFSGGGGGFSRGGAASSGSFSRGGGGYSRGGGGDFSRGGTSGERFQQPAQRSGQRQDYSQRPAQTGTAQGGAADRQGQRQQAMQGDAADRQGQRQDAASGMQQDRQDYRTDNREDWQKQQDKNREDWQDYGEDVHWDNHWHGNVDEGQAFVAGAVVGATAVAATRPIATTTYVTTLPCSYTISVINGTTYYQCGSTWYSRGYVNGSVTYMVIDKPVF